MRDNSHGSQGREPSQTFGRYQDPSQYSAYTAKRLGGGEAAVS
ncbi:hypothetical protein CKA32_000027 [Geitlerinema sp. FC II]|nr:hypothetical protein CKA32_000027 [Geitlerinema sp. FC II]